MDATQTESACRSPFLVGLEVHIDVCFAIGIATTADGCPEGENDEVSLLIVEVECQQILFPAFHEGKVMYVPFLRLRIDTIGVVPGCYGSLILSGDTGTGCILCSQTSHC